MLTFVELMLVSANKAVYFHSIRNIIVTKCAKMNTAFCTDLKFVQCKYPTVESIDIYRVIVECRRLLSCHGEV